jgi:hypothetical protein
VGTDLVLGMAFLPWRGFPGLRRAT